MKILCLIFKITFLYLYDNDSHLHFYQRCTNVPVFHLLIHADLLFSEHMKNIRSSNFFLE